MNLVVIPTPSGNVYVNPDQVVSVERTDFGREGDVRSLVSLTNGGAIESTESMGVVALNLAIS